MIEDAVRRRRRGAGARRRRLRTPTSAAATSCGRRWSSAPRTRDRIVAEEQFGPTVPLLAYDTVDEAVARANAGDLGLAASVWSADEDRAFAVAARLEAGFTFVNTHNRTGMALRAPFGGVKRSGWGREYGDEGLVEHTQTVRRARARGVPAGRQRARRVRLPGLTPPLRRTSYILPTIRHRARSPMSQTLKSVQEHFDEAAADRRHRDVRTWLALVERLKARLAERFELSATRHRRSSRPSAARTAARPAGSATYAGPEIDWMVHSHMENAAMGFCNVHLTVWLGPQVRVPHFGMALGAFPQGWIYLDSVPRVEPADRHRLLRQLLRAAQRRVGAGPPGQRLPRRRSSAAARFVRAGLSPTAHCYMAPADQRTTDLVTKLAEEHLDRWLRLGRRGRAGARRGAGRAGRRRPG